MDYQVMFNIVLGGFCFLAGFLLNNIWQEVKPLQQTDKNTIDHVKEIQSKAFKTRLTIVELPVEVMTR